MINAFDFATDLVQNPSLADPVPGCDAAFVFRGSSHVMIGMAIYMGFENAYLVGCEYTHSFQAQVIFS